MQIILMRHGVPKIDKYLRLNAAEFGMWVEKYNTADIDTDYPPPQQAIDQAGQCTFVICSNLTRSVESAKVLGIEHINVKSPLFREMDIPHTAWRFPRLSLSAWSIFFRLIWICGYSAHGESFKSAKERARYCAETLANLSSVHGTVIFVGHGTLNWFIARYLKHMGWLCSKNPPRRYWEFSVFSI